MKTRVFNDSDIHDYALNRLFGSNVSVDDVSRIELHNGILPSELESLVSTRMGDGVTVVNQRNGREPILFHSGVLFIPQYSGFGRRERYEEMIEAFVQISGKDIKFESKERKDDPRETNVAFDNLAYDFTMGLFVPSERYDAWRIFPEHDIGEIRKIIFGPTSAVAKQSDVVAKGESEYLDAQIIEVEGERILNLGYVYSDQVGILLDKITREYDAIGRRNGGVALRVGMLGRVGGLAYGMQRHDLVFPHGIIDEVDLETLDGSKVYPIHNRMIGENGHRGVNLNVTSVINESPEDLRLARDLGCVCVEMEVRESVEAINRARRRYHNNLNVGFGFVGHVSDLPLQGDTLAKELDSDKGERNAVRAVLYGLTH
ncbi:hypothetical protein HN419_03835 [Candidatus Woesearchaeota archaeon]|jgi:hypothetical protein|nr:hypothetical protein [Candidatus Woesearchaeota archaeon]MBT3537992.1 hypothetical protein [Candidatus Woesearchaeota archaeon]MBT4697346.1 hypothetical protein [Candidatus Woesearchaeota archaeon]MBT4717067.1 hypothetical protein [Candidatus Woesearchaeota archaeon]MBT7105661.1 hypothetical protein [Candidatus Woesearchaeota archaeon]